MLWWLATNTYVPRGSSCSNPLTSTRTPVVPRIQRDQVRAHQCAKYPLFSKKLDAIDIAPNAIVYRPISGIRKKTVRNQWKDFTVQNANGRRCLRRWNQLWSVAPSLTRV